MHVAFAQGNNDQPITSTTISRDRAMVMMTDLDQKALQALQAGNIDKGIGLLAEKLRLSQEWLGKDDPETLLNMRTYARAIGTFGRLEEAEPLFYELVALNRKILGEQNSELLVSLRDYVTTLQKLGRFAKAREASEETLRLSRLILGANHPDTISTLAQLANLVMQLNLAEEAELLFSELSRLRTSALGETHRDTLWSLNAHAYSLSELGRFDEAEPVYAKALRLRRKVLGYKHEDTLESLNNYGHVLLSLGRDAEAELIFAEAVKLSQEVHGPRSPTTLQIMSNYASTIWETDESDRLEEVERLQSEVLRLQRDVLGSSHPNTLTTLSNYTLTLGALGRIEEMFEALEESVSARRKALGDLHPDTLVSLANAAFILRGANRSTEAQTRYKELLRLSRAALGDTHPFTLTSLHSYAVVLNENGGTREALVLSRELIESSRSRPSNLDQSSLAATTQLNRELPDRQNVERFYSDVLWTSYDASQGQASGLQTEAFEALQLASAGSTSKAVAEAAARRFASSEDLNALVRERQILTRDWILFEGELVKKQASGEENDSLRGALRNRLNAVEARVDAIDVRLRNEVPRYFDILKQKPISLEETRRVLGDDEAVLFLIPTDNGTHSMAVTSDDVSWVRSDRDVDAISEVVEEFRLGLEIQEGDAYLPAFDLELAHDLYNDLIAPVEDALEGMLRVYVVADGALSRLPLGTLVTSPFAEHADGGDPEVLRSADWLADRYALVQLPSLQSLAYIRSFGIEGKADGEAGFIGFGAPVLEGKARLRGGRSATLDAVDATSFISTLHNSSGLPLMNPNALRKLAALPGTKKELEQVRAALGAPQNTLYLAERMTELSIRNADLSNTRILHLATHGFTSEDSGETAEPGLVFTPPAKARMDDDGYLAASEVVGLDLTDAEWVILSACNTASPSGKTGETGLSGLAQAFLYAGAESLLVSHWPVFDDIAPLLTVETLKRSQKGQPRAEALQAAMQAIRNNPELDADHPAVWAPFALVGEGR